MMTYIEDIASAITDALLAGPPGKAQFTERINETLGQPLDWTKPLAARLYRRFSNNIQQHQRREIIAYLCNDAIFANEVRRANKPLVRRHLLYAPSMHNAPGILTGCALPYLTTPGDLAAWLNISLPDLNWFADLRSMIRTADGPLCHYRYRWISKRHGGFRLLECPKPALLSIQRQILDQILNSIPVHPAAHGFCRGRSTLTYTAPHVNRDIVVRMDLQNFFGSIPARRIHGVFETIGYPETVARYLTGLCTNRLSSRTLFHMPEASPQYPLSWEERRKLCQPHLPQGAPTSPALANLCALGLDRRLEGLAKCVSAHYSRYADDIAFSFDKSSCKTESLIALVGSIAQTEGFGVNFRKTRVMERNQRQQLTGIIVNEKLNIQRKDYDQLKAILHNCTRFPPSSQNHGGHADFRAHLLGRIAYVTRLNEQRGAKLRSLFDLIEW